MISGDALTDIDLTALRRAPPRAGGIATLAVKQVPDTREYGVVLHDRDGRITGFQEKPAPEEALSNLGNCGIYVFDPRIFDYFPERPFVDWANDVFPVLLEDDVPFHIHEVREYWNDVGSLGELRQGTFDALRGELRLEIEGEEVATRRDRRPASSPIGRGRRSSKGPSGSATSVTIGAGVRLTGPIVIGDGASIGDGAQLRGEHPLPGHRGRARGDPDRRDRRPRRDPREHALAPPLSGRAAHAASKRSRRCCARSDSFSARMNSHTSATPITIDCSTAMIRPAIAWSESAEMPHTRAWWA